jgi:hypothetical protein
LLPALPRTVAAFAAAAVIPGLIVGSTTTSAQAGIVGCGGLSPTVVGTQEGERLEGTDGPDVIVGLGGDDEIFGRGGDDVICGGDGDDFVSSSEGVDRLYGEAGRDTLFAGDGDDLAEGGASRDLVSGEDGGDTLSGDDGEDQLAGGAGSDVMVGGAGTDIVEYYVSGSGVSVDLRAGAGAVNGNAEDGPEGARDVLRGLEGVYGSAFRDTLVGNDKANLFLPFEGRDLVNGRGGQDFFNIVDGQADRVVCGGGRDEVRFDKGDDTLKGCERRIAAD